MGDSDPTPRSTQEPAEGSRQTVDAALEAQKEGTDVGSSDDPGADDSNPSGDEGAVD